MKKIIALTVLAATFATTGAFGQGFFNLASGKSQTFDGFSTAATSQLDTKVGVALFWAAASTANPFSAAGYVASTPIAGNSTTTENYTAAQAWAALTGSSFVQAVSTAMGGNAEISTTSTGVVKYDGGGNFDITSTSPTTQYSLILISFDATQYASAAAAAVGGGAIGWSTVLQYTSGATAGSTLSSIPFGQFGTFTPFTTPSPEPTTVALAGLGGLALLGLRRRK